MLHFHPLKIKNIRQETEDCCSIAFEVPAELQSDYQFKQGQYVTLRAMIGGQDVRRSYSICSSPLENELRVAIKKIEGGKFSTFANEQLKKGDTLDVMAPTGNFVPELNPAQSKHYIGFAAGSGITPILSILKTALATEPNSQFTLFYGNKDVASIIFREEIEQLKNRYMTRLTIHHFLSREQLDTPLFNGRLSGDKCEAIFGKLIQLTGNEEFFLCGPESMIFSVRDFLAAQAIPAERIHFELFTSPDGKLGQERRREKRASSGGQKSQVTVKLDGKTLEFELEHNTVSILDAALKQGADLPFACKGGVCCTCKAKVLEGTVEMDVNYALVADEIKKGFVLSCQAFPTSERVSLDFDEL